MNYCICQLVRKVNRLETAEEKQFEVMKKKERNKCSITAQAYSQATTIHGLQYVFEEDLSPLEYCFWILVVFIGLSLATLLSVFAYIEWKENPVLTSVKTTGYPIGQIEFPSIAICAQVFLINLIWF